MSNIIVMGFSPRNIVGCLLKKGLQRGWGGGHGHPRTPLATPLLSVMNLEDYRFTSQIEYSSSATILHPRNGDT